MNAFNLNKTITLSFLIILLCTIVHAQTKQSDSTNLQRLAKEKKHDSIILLIQNEEENTISDFNYNMLIPALVAKRDFLNALIYAEKWETKSQEVNNTKGLKEAINYKVRLFYLLGKCNKTIETALKAEKIYSKNDTVKIATKNLALGLCYCEEGKLNEALQIYRNINFFAVEHKDVYYNNYAKIFHELKQLDSAIFYQKKCLEIDKQTGNQSYIVQSYSNIASSYMDNLEFKKALIYLDSALTYKNINNTILKELNQNMFTVYSGLNNIDSAFVYLEKLRAVDEALFDEKINEEIEELKLSYKREKNLKQKIEFADLELEKAKRYRLWYAIIFLLAILAAGIIIFNLMYQRIRAQRDSVVAEQQLLRLQMTPHFIFNSLSVIQGMILNKEDKKASNYLSKFSKLVRLILENSRTKFVRLEDELETIKNYIELQNSRFNHNFKYTINKLGHIDKTILIPPMIIQPFIENAIEHGFQFSKENNELTVDIKMLNDVLQCTITDNGIGIDAVSENKKNIKKSLSTKITKERLQILAKELKSRANITIKDRKFQGEKGTRVTIQIPFKNCYDS